MNRRAFTLAELVVVVAILALLTMVLLPTLAKTLSLTRRTICQNNLAKLSAVLSYANRATPGKTEKVSQATAYFPNWKTWPMQATAVAKSQDVFRCPEDELPPKVDIGALRKRIVFRSSYGGGVEIPLTGPADNFYSLSRTGTNDKGDYTEWVFEEAGNILGWGWDFWVPANHNDGWIRIFDRTGDIEIMSCNCGGDNQLWIDDKPAFGDDPSNRQHTQLQLNVGKTLNVGAGVTGFSSYGVNTFAHRYVYGSPVVVLLDYESDDPMSLGADPDEPAKVRERLLLSLRHLGKLNLLLTDGAVKTASLPQIDPAMNRALWDPGNLVPHPHD